MWRGASRHQSLIIYRPIVLFRSTTKPLIKEWGKEERSGVEMVSSEKCGDGEVECVDEMVRLRR